jgi:hypothetical protein
LSQDPPHEASDAGTNRSHVERSCDFLGLKMCLTFPVRWVV